MATTRFWKITSKLHYVLDYVGDVKKTVLDNEDLKNTLHYAVNSQKTMTEEKLYVTGVNCEPATANLEFEKVKQRYNKGYDTLGYHGYMSFAAGEVTPDEAHAIGVEFAEKNFPGFQVVVATHLNTGIIHNHFVVNSVCMEDGHMAHDEVSWFKFRHLVDVIVREHSLSVVVHPKRMKEPTQQDAQVEKYYQRNDMSIIKAAVDEAISESKSIEEFKKELIKRGYNYNLAPNRKYWTVTPQGGKKSFRLYHLGDEYTNQSIRLRLSKNMKSMKRSEPVKNLTIIQYTGSLFLIVRLFKHYKYMLDSINKHPVRTKYLPHNIRSEVRTLGKVSAEIRMMEKNKIYTMSELLEYESSLEDSLRSLLEERRVIYNQVRRVSCTDEQKKAYANLNQKVTKVRKEIRLCADIKNRSNKIQDLAQNSELYALERSDNDRSRDSNNRSIRDRQDSV